MVAEFVFWAIVAAGFAAAVARGMKRKPAARSATRAQRLASAAPVSLSLAATFADNALAEAGLRRPALSDRPPGERAASRAGAFMPHRPAAIAGIGDGSWDDLVRLAHDDPQAALKRIDALPAAQRRHPVVRFARVYALGNLIWGRDGVADIETFYRTLIPEALRRAEEGVAELALLEREAPAFFKKGDLENVAHRVCGPLEFHRAGAVQHALGWTKILFWAYNRDRYLSVDDRDPTSDELRDLPPKALVEMEATRFSCPRIVMSSCLLAARRTREGWVAAFALGARKAHHGSRVRDLHPIGVLTVREDGRWRLSPAGGAHAAAAVEALPLAPLFTSAMLGRALNRPLAALTLPPRRASSALVLAARAPAPAPDRRAALSRAEWEELLELAKTDPEAALRRIDAMDPAKRRDPLVRFVRVYALGNIIWAAGTDDMQRTLQTLSRDNLRRAEEAVAELAALEADAPDFFAERTGLEPAVNRVCLPLDFHKAGAVQRALGWTKILYWALADHRYYSVDENGDDAEELKDLLFESLHAMMITRIRCPRIIVSSCILGAKRTDLGWIAGFALGARKGAAGGGKVADLEPFAILTIRDDGVWHIDMLGQAAYAVPATARTAAGTEAPAAGTEALDRFAGAVARFRTLAREFER